MNKRPALRVSKKISKTKKNDAPELFDSFFDGFSEWLESEEGVAYDDLSSAIHFRLDEVELDTKKRLFIFSKKKKLTFEEVAAWIQKEERIKALAEVYDALISWMEIVYDPKSVDTEDERAVDLFDEEINAWIQSI